MPDIQTFGGLFDSHTLWVAKKGQHEFLVMIFKKNMSDSSSASSPPQQQEPPAKASSYKVLPTTPTNNNGSTSGVHSRSRTTIRPLPGSGGSTLVAGHHHPSSSPTTSTNNTNTTTTMGRPSLPVLPSQDNLGAHTHRLVSTMVKTALDYDQFAQVITTSPRLVKFFIVLVL